MEMNELQKRTDGQVDDLSHLDSLDEQTILRHLNERYGRDSIYTNCGDVLIAVNPCKGLPIFDEKHHEEHDWKNFSTDAKPHVFHIAGRAYQKMRELQTNQVILVSGESGAGKTESTKLMVKHFVHMCQGGSKELHDKIVQVNPLLEAFGNAKTIMNHNSSRFAKYLELSFRDDGQITGAVVRDYMIEKSRVVLQNENEGNFHIFYSLFAGAPPERMREMHLKSADDYKILKGNRLLLGKSQTIKYKEMYDEQMDVLEHLGMEVEELDAIHFILAAIIHLTEVSFVESDGTEGGVNIKDSTQNGPLGIAADLLSLDMENLGHALISVTTNFGGNIIQRFKNMEQAEDGRDAIAKALYERLFGWLVRQINLSLHPQKQRVETSMCIGVLDIAGFEKLRTNSFEQLCINMVNERLQNFMNEYLFKIELHVYKDEGIQMDDIKFKNNDSTIEIFTKKRFGLFALLDEQTKLVTGSHESLVAQLDDTFKDNDLYTASEGQESKFAIKHFAGQVWYDASQFLEKNRDMLSKDLKDCLKMSKNNLISDMFQVKRGPTGTISATRYDWRKSTRGVPVLPHAGKMMKKGRDLALDLRSTLMDRHEKVEGPMTKITASTSHKTVVSYFQESMSDLLKKMKSADPFFVRCIKPNLFLEPDKFDEGKVLEQLAYTGVTGIAKIRRNGYAVRREYSSFLLRYCRTLWPDAANLPSTKEATRLILLKTLPQHNHQDFRLGQRRVFMKEHVSVCMEKFLFKRQNAAAEKIIYYMRCLKKKKEEERQQQQKFQEQPVAKTRFHQPLSDSETSSTSYSDGRNSVDHPYDTAEHTGSRVKNPVKIDYRPPSPPPSMRTSHISETNDSIHSEEESKPDSSAKHLFWDIFQVMKREIKDRDVHAQRSMKIIKLVTYFVIFCILLFALVTQKISLMTLMSNLSIRNEDGLVTPELSTNASTRYMMVIVAMCIPYLLNFVIGFMKTLFGAMPRPHMKTYVFVLAMESLHTVGLCQLTFRILPLMDMPRGIMLLSAVALLPSMLRLTCASETLSFRSDMCLKGSCGRIMSFVFDLLAFLLQTSVIPVLVIFDYLQIDERSPVQVDTYTIIELVVGMVLVSFSWWENFTDDRFFGRLGEHNCWNKFIMGIRFDIQEGRPALSFVTNAWKIGLSFLLAYLFRGDIDFEFSSSFQNLDNEHNQLIANSAIIALIVSSFVAYYIGYISCKLKLQIFSFSIPMLLSTPIAIIISQLDCEYDYLSILSSEMRRCNDNKNIFNPWWHPVVGICWFISLYWITRYIWYPTQERLAKVERMFLNPLYCGILTEQHLVLNRRRLNRKIHRKTEDIIKDGQEPEKNVTFHLVKKDTHMSTTENTDVAEGDAPIIPMIYACATMWHENTLEMVQLMKSLFRLDKDQFVRKTANDLVETNDKDYYEFEAHILFDDSMEDDEAEERVPNDFVKKFVDVLEEAASSVHERPMTIKSPTKIPAPYGGQIVWEMPYGNLLYLHMKDKNKIRHRKRWSQVMYMYYLLGYRIVRQCQESIINAMEADDFNNLLCWGDVQRNVTGHSGKSQIFQMFDEEVNLRAANTYILALDGDVDFTPGAVRLLLDRMTKNDKVGAACGRIHPIGKGPMVWYQKFEYAVAHWLQKSTEHVLGCVLCSPGCFSLFRGSALMDDNVMKKYTTMPTEASHHLMFDQGEDRWLCTLLLQQGYRVDYAAASDAFTYAPEGFGEFFNQRRRWMPSTIANILDLLSDYKNTVTVNSNISMLYIFYQASLMVSTIIGPSTVLMMIAGAILTVFNVNLVESYLISTAPAILYIIVCFVAKPATQILVAELLSAGYAFIMMVVLVGCVITAVMESPFHPSVIFLGSLVIIFLVAAMFHPKEFTCIFYGALYFLCIPSGFLLLVLYSLCNMDNVSWGTREVAQKKTKKQLAEEKKKKDEELKNKKSFFSKFWPSSQMSEMKDLLSKLGDIQFTKKEDKTTMLLEEMNKNLKTLIKVQSVGSKLPDDDDDDDLTDIIIDKKGDGIKEKKGVKFSEDVKIVISDEEQSDDEEEERMQLVKKKRNDLQNPAWIEEKWLGTGMVLQMHDEECTFWKKFIGKYLYPIEKDEKKEKEMKESLKDLRNSACFGMAMINLLWMAINFMFQLKKPTVIELPTVNTSEIENENVMKVDVLGLMFVMFFMIIFIIQLVGMFIHRWGTFLHLISITELTMPCQKKVSNSMQFSSQEDMIDFCQKILSEPMPDYPSDDDDAVDQTENEETKRKIENNAQFGTALDLGKSRRDDELGKSLRRTLFRASQRPDQMNKMRQSVAAYLRQSRATTTTDESPLGQDLLSRLRSTLQQRPHTESESQPQLPSRKGLYNRRTFGHRVGPQHDMLQRVRKRRNLSDRLPNFTQRTEDNQYNDDNTYDTIPAYQGTLGRNFGKRLKAFAKVSEQNGCPVGIGRDTSHGQRRNFESLQDSFM